MSTLIVTAEMLNTRLDALLARSFPTYSRAYFQYLIASHLVLVNGAAVKKREEVALGDEIDICFELTPELSVEPENIPLDILYEDDHLIIVNKPAGMVTHPAPGSPSGTFANALLYHCTSLPGMDTLRPGIVHRLDKETSGVLMAAKTHEAHRHLVDLFASRQIKKQYLALCAANPGDRTIDAPLKRHPTKRQEMHVAPAGKSAISICRSVGTTDGLTWVEVELVTGRTHQIRAHLKHVRAPIVGDPIYGSAAVNKQYGASRQLLHAHRLSFVHPMTRIPIQVVAPLPPDMQRFWISNP